MFGGAGSVIGGAGGRSRAPMFPVDTDGFSPCLNIIFAISIVFFFFTLYSVRCFLR